MGRKIFDCGVIREMTPEEIAELEKAPKQIEQTEPTADEILMALPENIKEQLVALLKSGE